MMLGLLSSPLALLLAAALAFGGVQTLRLNSEQNSKIAEVAKRDAIIAQRDTIIVEQNASTAVYKQKAINQENMVRLANLAAERAGATWAARLAKEKSERPPAIKSYADELQACLGTFKWLRTKWNEKARDWNDEK